MQSTALREHFTLVMLTHKRPAFLRRALQYYKDFPGTLLVLDSSPEPATDSAGQFPQVNYRHLPQYDYMGFQAKITHGLGLVNTPYMALVADDDFILPGAIAESLDFLPAANRAQLQTLQSCLQTRVERACKPIAEIKRIAASWAAAQGAPPSSELPMVLDTQVPADDGGVDPAIRKRYMDLCGSAS